MPRTGPRKPYTPRMPLDQRREQLLDAALTIIARDGYAGVSIDAIAREIEVARTVVYGAFDSLSSLLYALLDRQEQRALSQLFAALPDRESLIAAQDPGELLVRVAERAARAVAADPRTWGPILTAPEGTPAAVRRRIDNDRQLVRAGVAAMLAPHLESVEIDTAIAAEALVALAEYFGRQIVNDPDAFDLDRVLSALRVLVAALQR